MDIDEATDGGREQKWEEKWSSTDTMDNDTLWDIQDVLFTESRSGEDIDFLYKTRH